MKNILIIVVVLIFFFVLENGNCHWEGPIEVVSGIWGAGTNEFGYRKGNQDDEFPRKFGVNDSGDIYINDRINGVIKKYSSTGILKNIIRKPNSIKNPSFWAHDILVHFYNGLLVSCSNKQYLFYDHNDNLIMVRNKITGTEPIVSESGYLFEGLYSIYKKQKYLSYSIDGGFLGIFDKTQIYELGEISKRKTSDNKLLLNIKYPDKHEYSIVHYRNVLDYHRDKFRTFYIIEFQGKDYFSGNYNVYRQTACNKKVIILDIPKNKFDVMNPHKKNTADYYNWKPSAIIEYGQPIISNNGHIYCWARTKTHYKVLKWTWQGSEDAPQSVITASTKNGLLVKWKKPKKKLSKVTGYEISRSLTPCGVYAPFKKVSNNIFKYKDKDTKENETYFYQVRAISKGKYSEYSNKAAGTNYPSENEDIILENAEYRKYENKILNGGILEITDLYGINNTQLKYLRNTIFAKYGREFATETLKEWFSKKSWYRTNPNYSDSLLTETDKKNIEAIQKVEKKE